MSLFSVWMTSCRLTMVSCFNSFINEISRIAVDGVPSSESRWISFSATSSPVCLFRPLKTWMSQHGSTGLEGKGYVGYRTVYYILVPKHTVAYVPSPSFSSCWNELGCLLSIVAFDSSLSRFCTLIVLGTEKGIRCAVGDGGNVRKGGRGEGRSRDVYFGLKRREAGVQIWWRIVNASFDPYSEAVVNMGAFAREDLEQGRG